GHTLSGAVAVLHLVLVAWGADTGHENLACSSGVGARPASDAQASHRTLSAVLALVRAAGGPGLGRWMARRQADCWCDAGLAAGLRLAQPVAAPPPIST